MKRRGFSYLTIITGLLVLANCSAELGNNNETAESSADTETSEMRVCSNDLSSVSTGNLAGFFGTPVRNIEGAVSFCLDLVGSGDEVTGEFRLEYEDDFGIRYYEAGQLDTFHGEISIDEESETVVMDVIFVDKAGFVQVVAAGDMNDIEIDGFIRYYNFPSFEDALNAQVEKQAADCQAAHERAKKGQNPDPNLPTVANCLGYNFPNFQWWENPDYYMSYADAVLADVRDILNDDAATKKIGDFSLDIGNVLQNSSSN